MICSKIEEKKRQKYIINRNESRKCSKVAKVISVQKKIKQRNYHSIRKTHTQWIYEQIHKLNFDDCAYEMPKQNSKKKKKMKWKLNIKEQNSLTFKC